MATGKPPWSEYQSQVRNTTDMKRKRKHKTSTSKGMDIRIVDSDPDCGDACVRLTPLNVERGTYKNNLEGKGEGERSESMIT